MKNLYSTIKNLLVIVCFIAAGVFTAAALSPSTANALHPCQTNECEQDGGFFDFNGDSCINNEGNGTACDMQDTGDCETVVCGHE